MTLNLFRLIGLTVALATGTVACEKAVEAPTPKAIFIIVDGIAPDVLESVATPVLDSIAGENGYTRSYVGGEVGGESESPTVSAVGYNHLLTGTWSNKHNVWTNSIEDPNYA